MADIKKYYFSEKVAEDVGVEEAIMFSNIYFWVNHNKKKGTNLKEEKYWTFNSVTKYAEQYPFWSRAQIRRIFSKLEKAGYVETGRFNKFGYDKTKWYTVTQKASDFVETDEVFVENINSTEEF